MNIKDLTKTFHDAWEKAVGYGTVDAEEAGIRAVVEALRDATRMITIDSYVDDLFNDILGDAGNEKAAGVTALEEVGAGLSPASGQAPAADPSPARCEWRMVGKTFANAGCEDEYLWSHEYKVCPSCGKPISFREK